MIRKLDIRDFKCIDSMELKLSKLNLLTGPNSAGKSTVIQALLLLAQSVKSSENSNVLNGEYVKLGKAGEIRNIYTNRKHVDILATGDAGEAASCGIDIEAEDECSLSRTSGSFLQDADIVYLNNNRIGVEEIYRRNLENVNRIGIRGEYAFDYLSKRRLESLEEPDFAVEDMLVGSNLENQVNYWLQSMLGYRIKADYIENTNFVRVVYERNGSNRPLRPYHIGTGVSYIANLIIAALSCKKGSIFIVENPEIHLHPAAQSKIIEFLAFLSKRGLQVIVETHSDHIFNGVRKLVRSKYMQIEDIQIYFVRKNERECSEAVKIDITKEGKIRNQQKGLFDQFDEDLDELLGLNEYE